MDYKYTLKKIECDLFNNWTKYYPEILSQLIEIFKPYARFKVINKNHINQINLTLKNLNVRLRQISFADRDYFDDQKKLTLWFTQPRKQLYQGEILEDIQQESTYIYLYKNACTGQDILNELEQEFNRWNNEPPSTCGLCDYEAFYAELEALCAKHECAERALTYLIKGN